MGAVNRSLYGGLAAACLAVLVGCGGGGDAATPVGTTGANVAPVANAGSNQNVDVGSVVTVDAKGSTDKNGDTLTYGWLMNAKPAGSTATLNDSKAVSATFDADVEGTYIVELTVSDGKLSSTKATITITAAPPKPVNVAANFIVEGKVGGDKLYAGSVVTAYDAAGKLCATTQADLNGKYGITAKCIFPIVLVGDIPDGNDSLPLADGVKGEGRQWSTALPEIFKDGARFNADLTPITTAATVLVMGRSPQTGVANSRLVLTTTRLQEALSVIANAVKPFMTATGVKSEELATAGQDDSAIASMLQMVRVTTVRIATTKQTLVKFQAASEHRPIVLSLTDGQPVSQAFVDTGLGEDVASVNQDELKKAVALLPELRLTLTQLIVDPASLLDQRCFMHNGLETYGALYDLPPGWTVGSSDIENARVLRINAFTNLVNETLEERNPGTGKLVYISFDFRDMRGMKRRGYTWLIKGDQVLGNGCGSFGSDWRVLGNQRPVYMRTDTYALHNVEYDSKFAARQDTKGTGISSFVGGRGPAGNFSHVLVSGPGIPGDGKVFLNAGGTYLLSKFTLVQLRTQGLIMSNPNSNPVQVSTAQGAIFKSMLDTESIVMTDADIKNEITDSFFDEQNTYQYRFFTTYDSLAPGLTFNDVLPKRPYLASELPFDYFSSVGVNLDNMVRALKQPESVIVNWSLPPDSRGKAMTPYWAAFQRASCIASKAWPICIERGTYIAEYSMGIQYPIEATKQAVTLYPDAAPMYQAPGDPPPEPTPTFMREAKVRVTVLDSLNRPIETAVGMDYTR